MSFSFRKVTRIKKRILAKITGRDNLHFLHIRKTGGTALKNALAGYQITPYHVAYFHPHRVRLMDIPVNHKVMFITRDPVSRFVSGFGSRLRQGAPAHHVPWTEDEALAFSRFDNPNSLALALNPDHPNHEMALHAMRSISHVRSSYWDWFGDETLLKAREENIFFIARIESLDADFDILKKALSLPEALVLPNDPRSAHRASMATTRSTVLSDGASELVKSWYLRDYDFIRFCESWRERHGGPCC